MNQSRANPGELSEPAAWLSDPHLPPFLKKILPRVAINGLRDLKARILTRGIPRRALYSQSAEDALASASLSIIVPIHDAPAVTRRCLISLQKHAPQAEIILVDDGSKLAETVKLIDGFTSRNEWILIRHKIAGGHSAACAAGAQVSTRPFLCLLNSDTVVTPWCWRRAKEVFDQDQTIGASGPSTSNAGTSQTLPLASSFLPYWNDNQICNFANRLLNQNFDPNVVDLPWISGFAFFLRLSLWQELGGFDLNLPDYGNEVDLCRRLAERGYRSVWIRNSYIHHFGRQSYRDAVGDPGILERIRVAEIYNTEKHQPIVTRR